MKRLIIALGLILIATTGWAHDIADPAPAPFWSKVPGHEVTGDLTAEGVLESQPFSHQGKKIQIINPYVTKSNSYKGQLHTHSTNSDGADTPSALETAYEGAGYDFMMITDHAVMTTDPAVSGILHINGEELTATATFGLANTPHLGVLGHTSGIAGIDRRQDLIDTGLGDGAIISIHHPARVTGTINVTDAEMERMYDFQLIEIYNDHIGAGEGEAEDEWDVYLSKNRRAYGTAADDCHDIAGGAFNDAWVVVYADSVTRANILTGLRSGNFYSTQGPDVTISISGKVITATTSAASTIEWLKSGGIGNVAADAQADATTATTDTYTITGDEGYIRVRIVRDSDSLKAWSQPIFVNLADNDERKSSLNSSGVYSGDGDVDIYIDADNDNVTEADVPTINLTSDAGATIFKIGIEGNGGDTFTNSLSNAGYFVSMTTSGGVQFGTNSQARLTVQPDGDVGIGTIYPDDDTVLEIAGSQPIIIPRINKTARDAVTPQAGMQVYVTSARSYQYYEDNKWVGHTTVHMEDAASTVTTGGDTAQHDVGGFVFSADGYLTTGYSFKYYLSGTKTGANAQFTVRLMLGETASETAILTLTSVDATAGDWHAEITLTEYTGRVNQHIYGCLYQTGQVLVCDDARTTVDMNVGTTQSIKMQIAATNASDTVTSEYYRIDRWYRQD